MMRCYLDLLSKHLPITHIIETLPDVAMKTVAYMCNECFFFLLIKIINFSFIKVTNVKDNYFLAYISKEVNNNFAIVLQTKNGS